MDQSIADAFHESWYHEHRAPWTTTWRGHRLTKNPMDLWVCAEIIHDTQPDVLLECGTFEGGSAQFYADMMDLNGHGQVVSIDIRPEVTPPHPRITYITGNSATVRLPPVMVAGRVMVVLDSNHSKQHVLDELNRFGPLVTPGCYLIVEDSNVGGNPIEPSYGPDPSDEPGGPHAAIMAWLPLHPEFEVDKSKERYVLTMNPDGWLHRVS